MIKIRAYRKTDFEKVRHFYKNVIQDRKFETIGEMGNEDFEEMEKRHMREDGTIIIAEEDEQMIAFGSFIKMHECIAEITRLRVHPDYQDKGFSRVLISSLEERAKEKGYKAFNLRTPEGGGTSVKKCHGLGFTRKKSVINERDSVLFEKYFD